MVIAPPTTHANASKSTASATALAACVALACLLGWHINVSAATDSDVISIDASVESQAAIPNPVKQPGEIESHGPAQTAQERWDFLRNFLFKDRELQVDSGVVVLESPNRARDAARVPVTIRATIPQDEDRFIERIYLIIDKNPVPVAATFKFKPNNGWATINTEVRVNEYSHIRAIAVTSDNVLHMDSSFIKAAGGCSAQPSSYERSDQNMLGRIQMNVDSFLQPEVPALASFRLTHPNSSGMQFDQFSRTYIPAHYIHTMGATFNDDEVFSVETNFSLSQDPVLGFNFVPTSDGDLRIFAIDSEDQRFEKSFSITAK